MCVKYESFMLTLEMVEQSQIRGGPKKYKLLSRIDIKWY